MVSALDTLAKLTAEGMVNSVVAGSILTILAWSLLRLAPSLNARTRVAIWLSVLVAVPGLSVAAMFIGGTSTALASPSARIILPESWAFAIFVVWALLAAVALLRVAVGLWRIRSLRRTCRPINLADLDDQVRRIVEEYRPKRPVALIASKTARVPMAVGFFRPAVILPEWVLAELSANEISAILIHEFAHLRCWDDWTNFFQKLVRAGFFFHPCIWWVDGRLALDREIACDDAVLAATNQAHDYARCLVDLAEKSLVRRSLAMAQAAVHRVQHISVRISRILDSSRPHATGVSRIALGGVTGLAGLCLVALLQSPALIAFQAGAAATAAPAPFRTSAPGVATAASAVREASRASTVVPVVMRERSNILRHSPTRAKQSNVALAHAKSREVVLPARFTPPPQQPKVVRAGLTIHQPMVIPVESVLFVMPDARLDASGNIIWTLSVWHLTVFHPAQVPVEGTISNSI